MSAQAIFRADGSKIIGMGHLNRVALVAEMLSKRFAFKSKLVMKKDPDAETLMRRKGVETIALPQSASYIDEIKMIKEAAGAGRPSLIVLDVLEQDRDIAFTGSLRKFGCPIIAVTDDSNKRTIDADIIVNGNPNQVGQDYTAERGKYLLGPMYFIMDPQYGDDAVRSVNKSPDKDAKKIVLTFGGSDQNNLLFRVLDVLNKMKKRDIHVLIAVSQASGYVERLKKYTGQMGMTNRLVVDADCLAPYWRQCDLAITGGGNTLFERIAANLPGATLCQCDRQMEIADRFESLGVNINLGMGAKMSDGVLAERLGGFIDNEELQYQQRKRSPEITDGKGLSRLGDAIETLLEGHTDELRSSDKKR